MRGIWLENQVIKYRDDLPAVEPDINEALVRVRLAGICGTDLQLINGYYPYSGIPGHEFAGEVIEASSKISLMGRRVVGEINTHCGNCQQCQRGHLTHCQNRRVLGIRNKHGAFAEYLCLPVDNLHVVPDNLPDQKAVFTEPTAAAVQILEQVSIGVEDSVLIIGAGRLGQLIAQVVSTSGCRLQVVARYHKQRAFLDRQQIETLSENQLPIGQMDVVIDASGSPSGFQAAITAVRPRGTIVLKSSYRGEARVDLAKVVVNEINIIGSRCGPFDRALDLLQNAVDPSPLIEASYPLEQAAEAFAHAQRPGTMKILFTPQL